MKNLFEIIYEDNTIYYGNLQTDLWSESLYKKIKCVLYRLPSGDSLILSGYQKYYHMIEVVKDLSGEQKGILNFEYSYIIGKKLDIINIYKINLKTGLIEFKQTTENDKFIKGLNLNYWR